MNNFYPRSPCGERPLGILGRRLWYGISIHALLAESDRQNPGEHYVAFHFYPRSPCGERPGCQRPCERPTRDFYPRSPCGERRPSLSGTARHTYFYPRSPCGERLVRQPTPIRDNKFLSTLSLRRATGQATNTHQGQQISIHALLAESDRSAIENQYSAEISIHALLAESDLRAY